MAKLIKTNDFQYSTFNCEEPRSLKTGTCLPARYIFGIMSMLGVMVAYLMRACLSIAITQMVISHDTINETVHHAEDTCPNPEDYKISRTGENKLEAGEFDWDEKTQGIILSAFYYGYILTHVPGGLLAQKYGGKHTLGLGILSTAIFTLLTPAVAYLGAYPLTILRFLEGFGEGVTFPALCTMLAQWAPPNERSTLSTAAFTGAQIGTVFANLLGGMILQYVPGGWESVFYIFGGVSVIWFILWCLLCYNDPSSHPFISESEKLYLKQTIGETERKKNLTTPWTAILTSLPVWALIIAEIGHDWGLYTMVTDLPKYMSDVMKFNPAQNGLWSSTPYLATWTASLLFSLFADWLLQKNSMSCTSLRKTFATVGSVGPAIGVVLASYVGCDRAAATMLFTFGMGLMGAVYCSLRVNALDLSPNYSGTIMALVNGAGCLSGMLTPMFTGFLTPNRSLMEWRIVFWIVAIILVVTNFVYVGFGSGDLQKWNEPTQDINEIEISNFNDDNKKIKENPIA